MPSSSRFGSSAAHSFALFRLAFATAPPRRVNLANDTNSLAHYAKGTQSGISLTGIALLPLVGTGLQNLFHSPSRGSFHLSLTVLCAIGDMLVFSLGSWWTQIPTGRLQPHGTWEFPKANFASLTGLSPTLAGLPRPFCSHHWSHIGLPQPQKTRSSGLDSSRFARHYSGNLLLDFFSCRY